jgi:hypothetical protein
MWSEKCDSDLFLAEIVWDDSFSWSCLIISSSVFFWSSNLTFWRMAHAHSRLSSDVCLSSICRVVYACLRSVERRLWWDVKLDEALHQTWSETTHQTWRKRRHLIKLDESVISSNLTKTSSHQIWRESLLIKLWDRRTILLLSDKRSHASTHDMKNLVLQNITFVRR